MHHSIKGLTRRVIVVDSPDKRFFEQAIFILSDRAAVGSEDILKEAARAASGYAGRAAEGGAARPERRWLPYALTGAAASVLTWLAAAFMR